MKKIVFLMILVFSLIFIGSQNNQVEAADYHYVGTYKDGSKAYITDTFITFKSEYGKRFFSVLVAREINGKKNTKDAIMYDFFYNNGEWEYMSFYSSGKAKNNSVEWNIGKYLESTSLFKKNFK